MPPRRLTATQIRTAANGAGFSGVDLTVAVAIAFAESGGDPRAHNPRPPDNSYGLWQINMIGGLGPARRKQFNLPNNEALFDPATNARVAYAIYKARGSFADWSTYNNKSYKRYMTKAEQEGKDAQDQTKRDALLDQLKLQSNPLLALTAGLQTFTEQFRKLSISWFVIVLAVVLIILGIVILTRKQSGKLGKLAVKAVL